MSEAPSLSRTEGAVAQMRAGLEIFAVALVLSSLAVAALGHDPFRMLAAVAQGAFGGTAEIHATLAEAVPLILAGLAVALPLRLGLFNVGAEGQLVLGGLVAGLVAAGLRPEEGGDPTSVLLVAPICCAAAAATGALWGGVAGFLRARLGVHEVLSTILLNLIAWPLAGLVIRRSWANDGGQIPQTHEAAARLPEVYPALALAVVLAVLYDAWMSRTRGGLVARAVGGAPRASTVIGLPVSRALFLSLTVGGAFAGLVGAQQVLDQHGRYVEGFSPGFGFTAIAVALLGRGSGIGVVLAAVALGALKTGAFAMDALQVAPREVATIVQGVVILTAAALSARQFGQSGAAA